MTAVSSHIGPTDLPTLLIKYLLGSAVNKIPSKGKIHPPIAKMKPLKILFHRSGGRQTAVVLQQIEKCGSLPRSRYTGFAEVSKHKKAAERFRGFAR